MKQGNVVLTKKVVGELHESINKVLEDVAEREGFKFQPGNMRYDSSTGEVSGRMRFILADQVDAVSNRNAELCGFNIRVNDEVRLAGKLFIVQSVSNRGRVSIRKKGTGKIYGVREPEALVPLKRG